MSQKKPNEKTTRSSKGAAFRFVPDLTEDTTPWSQHHFGHDFSGGAIVRIDDEELAQKLRSMRFFGEVDDQGNLLDGQFVNSTKRPEPSEGIGRAKIGPRKTPRMEEKDPDGDIGHLF